MGTQDEKGKDSVGYLWLEDGVVPDPWLLRCALEDYVVTDVRPDASDRGTVLDACWTTLVDVGTAQERMRERERMRVQFGRYGHQDMMGWDDVELPEFFRLYRDLADLMKGENGIQSVQENT
jgi:hypothetical protein